MPLTPLPPRPVPGSETFEADAGALLDALPVYGDELNALQEDVGAKQLLVAADRVQTGQDRVQTAEDRAQTGQDRAATVASQNDALGSKNAAAASAELSSNNAAEVLSIYGTTAAMQAKLDEAKAQSSAAQTAAASASSVLQQDLSAVSAALHRSPNAITAMCIMDLSKDSDGGAWADRCQHTSWYNEPLCGAWRGQLASEAAARAISSAATGDYFQLTTDGKHYKLNAGAGVEEVFRGNKAKPGRLMVAVAEAGSVTVYDLTEPGRPMWMRFSAVGLTSAIAWRAANGITSLSSLNGILFVGSTTGALFNFPKDDIKLVDGPRYVTSAALKLRSIAFRNLSTGYTSPSADYFKIVMDGINAIAMTVLPDAPTDPVTGLQVPTIAVATAGGASVIKHDGTVVNLLTFGNRSKVIYDDKQYLWVSGVGHNWEVLQYDTKASLVNNYQNYGNAVPVLFNHSAEDGGNQLPISSGRSKRIITGTVGTITGLCANDSSKERGITSFVANTYSTGHLLGDIRRCYLANTEVGSVTGPELVTNGTFDTDTAGWTLSNATFDAVGGVANFTSTLGAGWAYQAVPVIVGKKYLLSANFTAGTATSVLIGAGTTQMTYGYGRKTFSGSGFKSVQLVEAIGSTMYVGVANWDAVTGKTFSVDNISLREYVADRSYKTFAAFIYGTLTKIQVAAAAQLVAYSGFSASNYVQELYSADLDFGTGEWRVAVWVSYATAVVATIAHRGAATGPSMSLGTDAAGKLTATAYDGTTTLTVTTDTAYNTGIFTKVTANYKAGKLWIAVNGLDVKSVTGAPLLTLANTSAVLTIGNSRTLDAPFPGSIALLKLGATVPTTEQGLWMYEQEKFMFAPGAQITLPASTAVLDLTYDEQLDKWVAVQAAHKSNFTGLVRTAVVTPSAGSFSKVHSSSGVELTSRTTTSPGVDVFVPAYGLREELVRRAEAAAKASKTLTVFDFDAVAAQTDFVLPVGWTATEVTSAGASQREGATKQFVRLFDGFRETIRFAVAPGAAAWIQINARKE